MMTGGEEVATEPFPSEGQTDPRVQGDVPTRKSSETLREWTWTTIGLEAVGEAHSRLEAQMALKVRRKKVPISIAIQNESTWRMIGTVATMEMHCKDHDVVMSWAEAYVSPPHSTTTSNCICTFIAFFYRSFIVALIEYKSEYIATTRVRHSMSVLTLSRCLSV